MLVQVLELDAECSSISRKLPHPYVVFFAYAVDLLHLWNEIPALQLQSNRDLAIFV